MTSVMIYKVVRLKSDKYEASCGDLGVIMRSCEPEIKDAFEVQWMTRSFSSVPVLAKDLEFVGEVSFPIVYAERQKDGSITRVVDEQVRDDGLTTEEGAVKDALSGATRRFARLDRQHPTEGREFQDGIHRCQSLLALRACRRAFPVGWPDRGGG